MDREYIVNVPRSYDAATPSPLVLNFHGFTSNYSQQEFFSAMNPTSEDKGFIVVYPNGLLNTNGDRSWNAGTCCADDAERDDLGFVDALLDEMESQLCVDLKRVYTTGMSNGGFMSYNLACNRADRIAAGSSVTGALGFPAGACNPSRPISFMQFHGTADPTVPYASAVSSVETWRSKLNCSDAAEETLQNGTVTCVTNDECDSGTELGFCTAEGMGHCWPGQTFCLGGDSTTDISANDEMWDFFLRHPLP